MISCLPSTPGYALVRRTAWTISIAFRSWSGRSAAGAGRRRVRTSCIVTVEAPRWRPSKLSTAADTIPNGSNPGLSQNVLSSIAVVASTSSGGISSKVTRSRRSVPNVASRTLPVRS